MIKKPNLILVLAVLPLVVVGSTILADWQIRAHAPKAVQKSTAAVPEKERALASAGSTDAYYIGTGHYDVEVSTKSKIQKTEKGRLYRVQKTGEAEAFVMAADNAINPAPGWTAKLVGEDAMWIPGACAQKPSWMIGDHQVMIDDGEYDGAKATHYYALYDTNTKKFTHFGGSLANDVQAKEKILAVNIENGKVVFYIDQQDATGPYTGSTSFKHSLANHDPFIIRRVIETPNITYTDYRVPYTKPAFDDYHVAAVVSNSAADSSPVTLQVTSEGGGEAYAGLIEPSKAVTLGKSAANVPAADPHLLKYQKELQAVLSTDGDHLEWFSYMGESKAGMYLVHIGEGLFYDFASRTLTSPTGSSEAFTFTLGAQ